MESKHVVVIGGSVSGLGTALALSGRGHRVTVLEADATPMPDSHSEAFSDWQRQGSPQTRHSHAFLARLRNLIRDHAPELLEKLLACGAEELRFVDRLKQIFPDAEILPGDDDMVFLACRRITFEWVLRRHVIDTGLVEFIDGARVVRLEAKRAEGGSAVPTVSGVWVERKGSEPELITGDLVVDASGRRSKLNHWLAEIGGREMQETSSPCGIFYTSRFYALKDGVEPPTLDGGIVGVDLGYLKCGIFAGDSRVFSITLAASPTDADMRKVLHEPAFEVAVSEIPQAAEWTSPEMAEPVSDVHGMANLNNTRRFFWVDGVPAAYGLLPLGDALIHTNPIVGRGCSLAWTSAFALAGCLDEAADLGALAKAYEAHIERDIVPWYQIQVAQDADAVEVAEAQKRGEDPFETSNPDGTQNPKAFMRSLLKEGLMPALQEDVELLRLFMRTMNLLDPPGDLMKNPKVMQSLLASYAKRDERPKVVLGPSRGEMVERFAAAGA